MIHQFHYKLFREPYHLVAFKILLEDMHEFYESSFSFLGKNNHLLKSQQLIFKQMFFFLF